MHVHLATAVATPLGCASLSAWPQSDVLLYGTLGAPLRTCTHITSAMRSRRVAGTVLALLAVTGAPACHAACAPMRFGFLNQHAAPYYLGDGGEVPEPAGASVELVREMAAAAGCPLQLMRMPVARLTVAVDFGQIDAAPIGALSKGANIVLPLDASGAPDVTRGMHLYTIIFVRAADNIAHDVDTPTYLRGQKVGLTHGVANVDLFRQAGIVVDDGASNTWRNFDKLKLRRVDAVAVSLTSPGDLDAALAARHGQDIVRLDKPLRVAHLWLGVHRGYYEQNRVAVEAMWSWLGAKGESRLTQLLKKYDRDADRTSPAP